MTRVPGIRDLFDFHVECLQGMYFSTHRETDEGHLLFSDYITDPYYNFLAPYGPVLVDEAIQHEFRRRDRTPAVYAVPFDQARENAQGFSVWASDAWLMAKADSLGTATAGPPGMHVETVDRSSRDVYVNTFTRAYSGDDPDDPYGQLDPAYARCLAESFDHDNPGYRKYYVLASVNGSPVGVAALFTTGVLAGVYGVGTIPSSRRRGIGQAIMAYLAALAMKDGVSHVMLQTEAESSVQRWYEHLGYGHVFTAPYLVPDAADE